MRRILAVLAAAIALTAIPATAHAYTPCTKFVSTLGNDTTGTGSSTTPWRTVLKAVNAAVPGDQVCIRAGLYVEEVVDSSLPSGTAAARITLRAATPSDPASWPVIDGRVSLSNLAFWTISNIKFTNPTPTATDLTSSRIVALIGGNDVVFENNEVYDGRYAGLLVGRSSSTSSTWPMRYTLRGNYIHDTDAANVYFNPGRPSSGHLIERNRFARAGTENLKVGWGDHCDGITPTGTAGYGAGGTTVRFNTMADAGSGGNFIVAEPGGLHDVIAERNLMVDKYSDRGFHVRYDSATATTAWPNGCLGDRATVTNTWAYGYKTATPATQILFSEDYNDAPLSQGRETGNVTGTDPQLDANLVPQLAAAQAYGHAAPVAP